MYNITCSTQDPNLEGALDDDNLSIYEVKRRDELIRKGIDECKQELRKQESNDMYFFYEGSISGFEACKSMYRFSDYTAAILEEATELDKELAKSQLISGIDPVIDSIREEMGIDLEGVTDDDLVWSLKGKREQILFVYNRLKTIKIMQGEARTELRRLMKERGNKDFFLI